MDRKDVNAHLDRLEAAQSQQPEAGQGVSAAQQYERDGLEGPSLANAPDVNKEFTQAHDHTQQQQTSNEASQDPQKSMANTPQHNLNPPASMRSGPDRMAHAQQLSDEQQRALELNEAIKARHNESGYEKMRDGQESGQEQERG